MVQYSSVSIVSPPAVEPVTVDQARLHCRIDTVDDDDILAIYIQAAREWAEMYLNRALITQTLTVAMAHSRPHAGWPYLGLTAPLFVLPLWFTWNLVQRGNIELPRSPAQSVVSVAVGTWGQPDVTLVAGTDYDVDLTMQPGRLFVRPQTTSWPQDHVAITFTAGYGDTAAALPASIVNAILLIVAFLYENRGDVGGDMPTAAKMLLTPYRLVTFGS